MVTGIVYGLYIAMAYVLLWAVLYWLGASDRFVFRAHLAVCLVVGTAGVVASCTT